MAAISRSESAIMFGETMNALNKLEGICAEGINESLINTVGTLLIARAWLRNAARVGVKPSNELRRRRAGIRAGNFAGHRTRVKTHLHR